MTPIKQALMTVLDEATAEEVIDYRKRMGKRYALTERSAGMLAKNLARCPDPVAAAEEMIVRGWQSVKPEWMKDRNAKAPTYADMLRSTMDGPASREGSPLDVRRHEVIGRPGYQDADFADGSQRVPRLRHH